VTSSALVSPAAVIGQDVTIGPFSIVHPNAVLADGVSVGSHCSVGHPSPAAGAGPLRVGAGVVLLSLAVVLLAATGLVKVESLKKHRGYVLLGIFIVAAILTPPDAVSQSFMAIPMYVLYELGILFAQYLVRQRAADKARHEAAHPGE